jgi:ferredoxin
MSDTAQIAVRFISADGAQVQEVQAHDGDNLLDVGQAAGQPLEGTCEGQMACSTCHVIVAADDFAKLPRASEAEEDMLDLAAAATRTSRLSCQITLKAVMKELTVRIPSESHNMQGL